MEKIGTYVLIDIDSEKEKYGKVIGYKRFKDHRLRYKVRRYNKIYFIHPDNILTKDFLKTCK